MIILYILLVLLAVILARTILFTPPKADEKTFEDIEQAQQGSRLTAGSTHCSDTAFESSNLLFNAVGGRVLKT